MSAVSPEDREKAFDDWRRVRNGGIRSMEAGTVSWHRAREAFRSGWDARPGGASTRPTREALAGALHHEQIPVPYHGSPTHELYEPARLAIADALLAADHLWTEQPNAPECICFATPESTWTTHYGAVEPGSQLEPNPDCAVHFPKLPAPVVDREALVTDVAGKWADALIAAGIVQDAAVFRASVEAEQREKDARLAVSMADNEADGYYGQACYEVAAAIRAGGAES